MSEQEGITAEVLFQQTTSLEKQFKTLLEDQQPFAVDVLSLLQRWAPSLGNETNKLD